MALSGDLKDFGLLQLLNLVHATGKSGSVSLQSESGTATVFFEDGRLTKVRLPGSRPGALADFLRRTGRIDQELHDSVVAQAPQSEKGLALLLEDQAGLSREEVMAAVREISVENLLTLLRWPGGSFRMNVNDSPAEEEISAPAELEPVLRRAQAYLDEWKLLTTHIPDLDRGLALTSRPRPASSQVRLSVDEWRLVASMSGEVSLREMAAKLDLDDVEMRRVSYRLVEAGLAELKERPASPPTIQQPPETPAQKAGGGLFGLFGSKKR